MRRYGPAGQIPYWGVKAALYPDEAKLAAAIRMAVDADVPFKATAGLHHAIRNTDPATGLEQHDYLNLLAASAAAATSDAEETDLSRLLVERDGANFAALVAGADVAVREVFRSFGTCSILEPLDELAALGLLPATILDQE